MRTIGRVMGVNVGQPRVVNWHDRAVTTAIWKQPVTGRRRLRGVNVDGDGQADRRVHGGPTKAVYAYAAAGGTGGQPVDVTPPPRRLRPGISRMGQHTSVQIVAGSSLSESVMR